MKVIFCQYCNKESEIVYERDEDLFDEPIYCPFCGKPDAETELLLEQEIDEWEE